MEYIAFGEVLFEEHSSSFSSPYLFNGKELDRETNLSYYGARYLDMKTSLWLSVDPLAEKMQKYGAYVYAFNNPVKFVDPDGRMAGPGDEFATPEDAARDFALLYNDNSIKDKKEYGALIYRTNDAAGKDHYSYTVPNVSSEEDGVMPMPDISKSIFIVAGVHTHSNYDKKYGKGNDQFSPADKNGSDFTGLNAYVSTPKGELLLYEPKNKKPRLIDSNIPSDINHPNRANKIDSSVLPKNEPTRGMNRVLYDNTLKPFKNAIDKTMQTVKDALTVPASLKF